MFLNNSTNGTANPAQLVPSPIVNYSVRLGTQLFGLGVFLTFYILSWVIIFTRRVPQSLLYHAKSTCCSKLITKSRTSNLLPPIPCFILIITNIFLLFRLISWITTAVQSSVNLVIHSRKDLVAKSTFLQDPYAQVYFEQIGLGFTLLVYLVSITAFGLLLVLWARILSTQIARSNTKSLVYNIIIVLTVVAVIFAVIGSTPALIAYFGMILVRSPMLAVILVYYVTIPCLSIAIIFMSGLMIVIGIRIRVGIATDKTSQSRSLKILIAKITLALVTIPLAMCVRVIGLILFALQIYFYSYLCGTIIVSFIPDFLITLGLFICFWPFKSAAVCCSFDKCKGNNTSLLFILFNPITNQDMLENYERDTEMKEAAKEDPVNTATPQTATPASVETPSTPNSTVELLPPQIEDSSVHQL